MHIQDEGEQLLLRRIKFPLLFKEGFNHSIGLVRLMCSFSILECYK
jgi:hypothetical protein